MKYMIISLYAIAVVLFGMTINVMRGWDMSANGMAKTITAFIFGLIGIVLLVIATVFNLAYYFGW